MTSSDAIVIGGGHNGLVCAAMLAKAGRKVLVLEAAAETGGAARSEEFFAGFRVSSVAHVLNRLHPDVVTSLDLEKHGLQTLVGGGMPSVALSEKGEPLILRGAYGEVLVGAIGERAGRLAGTARPAVPLCRHPEADALPPAARPQRHGAWRDAGARPGRRWR